MENNRVYTKEELFKILNESPYIKQFICKKSDDKLKQFSWTIPRVTLCGGAIIDILEGRVPNDYDMLSISEKMVKALELEYEHSSRTADTYSKNGVIVQNLSINKDHFDFTISQTTLSIHEKMSISDFDIDLKSFNSKKLIPCDLSWKLPSNAIASLSRIPHYRKKGYTISDITYGSLLGVARGAGVKNSKG